MPANHVFVDLDVERQGDDAQFAQTRTLRIRPPNGLDFSTVSSTSPLRAVAILPLDDFHEVSLKDSQGKPTAHCVLLYSEIAHRRMVPGRGILRNHGRNNNSPATGRCCERGEARKCHCGLQRKAPLQAKGKLTLACLFVSHPCSFLSFVPKSSWSIV
jgi:hypothetical protein